ncbi:MAG: ABC transporter ATP-binding protein [Clostridia bacterium]|nr:ABC transporter ATP-binding protein [Clostridia bacterium]
MKFILKYLRPHYTMMTVGLIIKIIGTLVDLIIPYILEHIIDNVVPTGQITKVALFGGLMILCAFIGLVANIVANRMACAVARDSTRAIRSDLFKKISYLSSKQIDEITIPTLETRLTSDTYNVHHTIGMVQRMGIRAPILLIGGIIITFTMEPMLCLVLLAVLPFITAAVVFVSKKGIPLYKKVQERTDDMVGTVRESAQGIRVIKALSRVEHQNKKFDDRNKRLNKAELKSGYVISLTTPLMNAFLNIGMSAVILVGAIRVNGGKADPGMIIAFMSYFTIILNAMLSITRIFTMFSKGAASADRISEICDIEPDISHLPKGEREDTDAFIEFRNVSFSYNGTRENLENISFTLKKGQTLGIIGATGSGKSTLIQLLLRFYDPDSGQVLIDGYDIRSLTSKELRSRFGTVLQNDFIYAGTLLDNISFGHDISEEEISRALDNACASEFVSTLGDGVDHWINTKGTNLSGGQRQRVLITRALSVNPEILILDDSSSALDYKTDATLRANLRKNYENATKVIVAQRVSSISHADRILVLDNGRVVGDGTHDELINKCDIYREISLSQIGGETQ